MDTNTFWICEPAYWTKPLADDFVSDADWLLPFLDEVWRSADSPSEFHLDNWQRQALRLALEIYPEGHPRAGQLRWRQFIIMVARQNGKSIIGAVLGLYGLIRAPGQLVIGVAYNAEQARILYDRTMYVIDNNEELTKRFYRLTKTRGIHSKSGSSYEIKASKGAAVQGLPVSVGLVDEAHIAKRELFQSLVSGTGGRKNGIVFCITTAGDEDSELLWELYEIGKKASQGVETPQTDRFGFICWEAEEAYVPDDPKEFKRYLLQANPYLHESRGDIENLISDAHKLPRIDIIRYHFNRFVASLSTFISIDQWIKCQRPHEYQFPKGNLIFAIDRSPDWSYATFTANVKDENGIIHTQVVASIIRPNRSQILRICEALAAHNPSLFVYDGYSLKELENELKMRGLTSKVYTQGDVMNASSTLYAMIVTKKMVHSGDEILKRQIPYVVRKNVGENFRISRKDSSSEIDGVMATALGVHAAETYVEIPIQLF